MEDPLHHSASAGSMSLAELTVIAWVKQVLFHVPLNEQPSSQHIVCWRTSCCHVAATRCGSIGHRFALQIHVLRGFPVSLIKVVETVYLFCQRGVLVRLRSFHDLVLDGCLGSSGGDMSGVGWTVSVNLAWVVGAVWHIVVQPHVVEDRALSAGCLLLLWTGQLAAEELLWSRIVLGAKKIVHFSLHDVLF